MQHKITKTLAAAVLALMLSTSAYAFEKPVLLQDQGSFFAGGTTVTTPGSFDFSNPLNPQGQTLHGDHAYVFYQKPVNAHKLPLVFLHGAGQSKKNMGNHAGRTRWFSKYLSGTRLCHLPCRPAAPR